MSAKETAFPAIGPRALRDAVAGLRSGPTQSKLLNGSLTMLLGSGLVSLANFGYNIALAHLLGPGKFSHAAAAVTILMLASCINLAFQLVTAKLIAKNTDAAVRAGIYHYLLRRAWVVGIAVSSAMAFAAGPISRYLQFPSPNLILILALGMLFYIPLGVRRGGMQGTYKFLRLSMSLTSEAVVKLIAAVAFVVAGAGVTGAVAGITVSVIFASLLPAGDSGLRGARSAHVSADFREALQAIIFFVGQVIINNVDILMVKHYFSAEQAGLYAAIALVGRLLYFATWSITSAMFPIAAGTDRDRIGRRDNVLALPLTFVVVLSTAFVLFLAAFPNFVLRTLFGQQFHAAAVGTESLLMMNAIAMAVYSIAVVLIAYEMSRRIANTGWLQLAVSLLVVAGIMMFHGSLAQVIVVQQVMRAVLLVTVSTPFIRNASRSFQEAT